MFSIYISPFVPTFLFLLFLGCQEVSNSLDKQIRQNISTFVDAIEEILVQHMRSELQFADNTREKWSFLRIWMMVVQSFARKTHHSF